MEALSSIGSSLYQGASSLLGNTPVRTAGTVIACAIGQRYIYSIGEWIGEKASALTGGRVTLSHLVPEAIKSPCREVGDFLLMKVIAPASDYVPSLEVVTKKIPNSMYFPVFLTVVACPMVEELVYRLPLSLAFSQIDNMDCLAPALLSVGDLTLSRGALVKSVATVFSSVAFTYGHERSSGVWPHNPGRAAALLSSGIGYALIATQVDLPTAFLVHAIYNMSAYIPQG